MVRWDDDRGWRFGERGGGIYVHTATPHTDGRDNITCLHAFFVGVVAVPGLFRVPSALPGVEDGLLARFFGSLLAFFSSEGFVKA